ncbi:hypothetical protein EVJ58_g5952 [Rhodofomes roseus]|uniref:Uncharacterized protein n=1 Tax=Rhodofomes roseus TaxID=34475 RepID=A0A4Y9YC54_9APHY|nr:hypothetical protein EVJ58_g5952 [Rhodofomes roseus]
MVPGVQPCGYPSAVRAYSSLLGFEVAVKYPPDTLPEQRWLTSLPIPGSKRAVPSEVTCGLPYDPFKVDVWQFAQNFSNFRRTTPDFDDVLTHVAQAKITVRPTAVEVRAQLADFIDKIALTSPLIPPVHLHLAAGSMN